MAEKQQNSSDGTGENEHGPRQLSSEEATSSQDEELRKNIARSPQMLNVEDTGDIRPHQPIVSEKTVGVPDETTTNTEEEHNSCDGGGTELEPRNSSSGRATSHVETDQDEEPRINMACQPEILNKDAPDIFSQTPTPIDAVVGPISSAGTTSEVKVDDIGKTRSSANMEYYKYLDVCGDPDGIEKIEPPLSESSHKSTAVHGLPSNVDLATPANKSEKDLENSQIFIAVTKSSSPPGMVSTPTKRLLRDHNAGDDQIGTPLKRSTTDLSLKSLDHDQDYF